MGADRTVSSRFTFGCLICLGVMGFQVALADETGADWLSRVFNIDIETCRECGGAVKVIACIEDPAIIKQILTHLVRKRHWAEATPLPHSRAPPEAGLFD